MKIKIISLVAIACLFIGTSAYAGNLNLGISYMEGHSNANTRCINEGFGLDLGYDWTVWKKFNPTNDVGFSLDVGGLFTFSRYETAYREKASWPESDHRQESSLTLIGVVKPTLTVWRISPYLLLGAGPDYMEEDGFDYGWTGGAGVRFKFSDKYSFDLSARKFWRHDTGSYRYATGTLRITF